MCVNRSSAWLQTVSLCVQDAQGDPHWRRTRGLLRGLTAESSRVNRPLRDPVGLCSARVAWTRAFLGFWQRVYRSLPEAAGEDAVYSRYSHSWIYCPPSQGTRLLFTGFAAGGWGPAWGCSCPEDLRQVRLWAGATSSLWNPSPASERLLAVTEGQSGFSTLF